MGKSHLRKGVVFEEGFIMNMRDLCHEYKGYASCIERRLHSERSMFGNVIGGLIWHMYFHVPGLRHI